MNFDLPSLQYFFKMASKFGIAQDRITNIAHDLEFVWNEEFPIREEFIMKIVNELHEIAKYLSKSEV